MTTKPLLVLKKAGVSIAILYSILLAISSLVNIDDMPKIDVDQTDKLLHILAYCGLMILWFNALFNTRNINKIKSFTYSISIAFIFGIIIEVLQGVFTSSRNLDLYDILANSIGITIGFIVVNGFMVKDVKKN